MHFTVQKIKDKIYLKIENIILIFNSLKSILYISSRHIFTTSKVCVYIYIYNIQLEKNKTLKIYINSIQLEKK